MASTTDTPKPRVVAILGVRNESLYIRSCLEHLAAGGVQCLVLDNESEDDTVAICREFYPDPVLSIESIPFPGCYDLHAVLARKDELRESVDADWIIHHDADEIMHSNRPEETLVDAIARVEAAGYNAIDFDEFVFIHENDDVHYERRNYYQEMRHYYYFRRKVHLARLVRAYSKAVQGDIARFAGHRPSGEDLRISPERMVLRHYICLSKDHAVNKYHQRSFSQKGLRRGWHRDRVRVREKAYSSPGPAKLQCLGEDLRRLDYSRPRSEHFWHWGDLRWYLRRRGQKLGRVALRWIPGLRR